MNGIFYGVGLGPGDPELVTLKALKKLQEADCIYTVGSRQSERSISLAILQSLPNITGKVVQLQFTMSKEWGERLLKIEEHAIAIVKELRLGKNCAFVTIGDPMTYSTCSYLLRAIRRNMPELKSEIIPGVNSWSALAAQKQMPLVEDREVLRIVPSYDSDSLELDFPPKSMTILLKTYHSCNDLLERIPDNASIVYGASLTLPEQLIVEGKPAISALPETYLSMLAVKNTMEASHD